MSYSPNRNLVRRYDAVVNAVAAAAVAQDHVKTRFGETNLHPHQIAAVKLFMKPNTAGLLLYYKVGSGKTLASIAAIENLFIREGRRRNVVVVTPASLQDNYMKELRLARVDHRRYKVMSYDKLHTYSQAARLDMGRGAVLVFDEVHTVRNPQSKRLASVLELSRHAYKRLLLTGTPIYNFPSDIGPLLAIINPANVPLTTIVPRTYRHPRTGQEITKSQDMFIETFGKDATLNRAQLDAMLRCTVLHYTPGADIIAQYPTFTKHFEPVTITETQAQAQFDAVEEFKGTIDQLTKTLNYSTMFTQPRQYNTSYEGDQPKLYRIVQKIAEAMGSPNTKCVVYSSFLRHSLRKLKELLRDWGIASEILEGTLTRTEKTKLVDRYNAGSLRVLLLSDAGKEGLDLKRTTQLHIVEPQWSMEKVQQIIGRVVRFRSHYPEQGHVHIYIYCAKLPREMVINTAGLLNRKSADEVLWEVSQRKDEINQTFLNRLHAISQRNLETCL